MEFDSVSLSSPFLDPNCRGVNKKGGERTNERVRERREENLNGMFGPNIDLALWL